MILMSTFKSCGQDLCHQFPLILNHFFNTRQIFNAHKLMEFPL